jgi:hypothetical protein
MNSKANSSTKIATATDTTTRTMTVIRVTKTMEWMTQEATLIVAMKSRRKTQRVKKQKKIAR